ncbi:heavy metal translocating P-type ATPase [Natrialbaceae archaeon A-gly3]
MSADRRDRCALCGRSLAEARLEDFCSPGCRDVADALGTESGESSGDDPERRTNGSGATGHVRTFLRVDGAHSVSCERFLEGLALACEGVSDAEASYVTETVRIDYDPDQVSPPELRDALSRAGYTAYLREEATDRDDDRGTTRRSREVTGMRKRRTDDMLEGRHIAGIVFGTFVLMQYFAIVYPTHFWVLYDDHVLEIFESALESDAALFFFLSLAILTGLVIYFAGAPLLRGAYVSLKTRRPNTALLVTIVAVSAYLYGVVAFAAGRTDVYFDLAVVVVAVVVSATFYEATIKRTATDRLSELTISQVTSARRYDGDGTTTEVAVADLHAGDRVLVREGERIPVDGAVSDGECTVDEAVVTGENLPVTKRAGEDVVGGSLVTNGGAIVRVGEGTDSTIDRLTTAVWTLQSGDHGVQRRTDELAAMIVPVVLALAVVVGLTSLLLNGSLLTASLLTLLTLVVASPWTLALATPLSVASCIREALERGVVVFDETVFERLRGIDVVVFDKTGTLTTGRMNVLEADAPAELLEAAAALERRSTHPAAEAIVAAFGPGGERPRTDGGVASEVSAFESHATGVSGVVDGTAVLVGHPALFEERGWPIDEDLATRVTEAREVGHLPVVVGREGTAEGIVVVGDEPREDWAETATALSERGIETVVLTGDDDRASARFRRHSSVDHVFAGVPPEGKAATVRRLRERGKVAMVGDGTNDAPALAESDLGIALGSGTALASDAADLAIVGDDLEAVETAFDLASAARGRVRTTAALALSYNAIVIPAALAGLASPFVVLVGAVASALLVAGNTARSLL